MSEPSPERSRFDQWVYDALAQLYDTASLRRNPLAGLLRDEDCEQTDGTRLRRLLLATLHTLRPPSGAPAASRDWRLYRLLELRFIEGLEPDEAMRELALGRSQYYRDQADARRQVADVLWASLGPRIAASERHSDAANGGEANRESLFRAEAERASSATQVEDVDAGALLGELRPVATQMAAAQGAALSLSAPEGLHLPADRVLLRQTMVNVLCSILSVPHTQALRVLAEQSEGPDSEASVTIEAVWPEAAPSDASALAEAETQMCDAHTMMALMGGVLHSTRDATRWTIRLSWPPAGRRIVLAIDDNQGLVDLYRRYLVGTVWQVVGAHSSAEARAALRERHPDVILLDLLMPQEDGLDLLVALKQDPETAAIPVVVCSVLSQPGFALELGATAYLPKPIVQEALLRLLRQWEGR
ncbi:MAG: response regulator [Anaerolineae bacterium]